MTPKMGRPIMGTAPKDRQIGFRISEETAQKFQECVKLSGKAKIELFEQMVDELYKKLTAK